MNSLNTNEQKKKAVAYIRVSTDEQKNKGYSLEHQEEMLKRFCAIKGIEIVKLFSEDFSGKTFKRPSFNILEEYVRKNQKDINYLLVLKWDRFGRNLEEALACIKRFKKFGIETNAVEQWLDFNAPDHKIMLALYLVTPEVENDKTAIRTADGMRKAAKMGRYVYPAPLGYEFSIADKGKKMLIPSKESKNVKFIQAAFEDFSSGEYNMQELRKELLKRFQVKCSKQTFYNILKNKLYTGIVVIKKTPKEDEFEVEGLHEPLVERDTFEKVQQILFGRKKSVPKNTKINPQLILRGHLLCPVCGRNLTGSPSGGNGGIYLYYHCQRGCKGRISAVEANTKFEELIQGLTFKEPVIKLYTKVLESTFLLNDIDRDEEVKRCNKAIQEAKNRIQNLEDKYSDNDISGIEFKKMTKRYNDEIADLVARISEMDIAQRDFMRYQRHNLVLLQNLKMHYQRASPESKKGIISSIFPRKIEFVENKYRTENINSMVALMMSIDAGFSENKKRQSRKIASQPIKAPPPGLEPGTPRLTVLCSNQLS